MAKCRIFGTILDGSDEPVQGVLATFIPSAMPAIDTSTGKAVHPAPQTGITTSTGEFEVYLRRNTDFVAIINGIGMKDRIRVPNLAEKNLFELVGGVIVTGDKTFEDTGESDW